MSIDYEVVFQDSREEPGHDVVAAEGVIPEALEGSFLRNGPGQFHAGADSFGFFDAYGFVAALGFQGGRARYRARFVKTPLYLEERAAGRMLRRRAFTNLPGRIANIMNANVPNPAMHDALYFGGRLYALDDPSWFRLDPDSFETMGEYRFDGRAGKRGKMSAVPRVDRARDRLVAYTVAPSPLGKDELTFLELDRSWNVVSEVTHTLDLGLGFTHEVAFTERWLIVVEPPIRLALVEALRGKATVYECLQRVPDRGLVAHFVPRDPSSGRRAARVTLPGGDSAMFHIANAYDDGDGVVLDGPSYEWPTFSYAAPAAARLRATRPLRRDPIPMFRRFRVDVPGAAAASTVLGEAMELPRINPAFHGRHYRFAYLAGSGATGGEPDPFLWAHEVVKVDVMTGQQTRWHAGAARFVSQPSFAPRPGATGEDDGWVLVWLTDASSRMGQVCILDAADIAAGPVATIDLASPLGFASHSRFEPELAIR